MMSNLAHLRTPAAWINDSNMSGARYVFVESSLDECFWKKYINNKVFKILWLEGWETVYDYVKEFDDKGMSNYCIGIIDSDFENCVSIRNINLNNVFSTDDHDIEMTMYHSEAFSSAIMAIDKKNKLKSPCKQILDSVLQITDRIGYLKLYSKQKGINLIFKRMNPKTHDIELPDYKSIIDSKGQYLGDNKLINHIITFSRNNGSDKKTLSGIDVQKLEKDLSIFQNNKYDSYQLSNGHDTTFLLPPILRRKYGLISNYVNENTIMIALISAYNKTLLVKTKMYKAMEKWANVNKIALFNF